MRAMFVVYLVLIVGGIAYWARSPARLSRATPT